MVIFNPYVCEDKRVYTFPKVINPKVNVIARLEFELAFCTIAVQQLNHYTLENPHSLFYKKIYFLKG